MDARSPRFLGAPLGPRRLFAIAGPCVIESEAMTMEVASALRGICDSLGVLFVFKSSYLKANRSDAASYTGPGMDEGLRILRRVREEIGVPVLTDIHSTGEAAPAGNAVSVLQIPAFLCRQTPLLQEAARRSPVVNVKKGQFLAPEDMARVLGKLREVRPGGEVWLTERGTIFGYRDLVVDMRGIATMRAMDATVVFDATHSLQRPGAGGDRTFVRPLARAALAAGADGLFLETHPDPERALSDATTQLPLDSVRAFLEEMRDWKETAARWTETGERR